MTPRWFAPLLAAAVAFGAGLQPPLAHGLQPAHLLAVALLPVWLPHLRHYVGARLITVVAITTPIAGVFLATYTSAVTTYTINQGAQNTVSMRILAIAATVGLLVWARSILPLPVVAILFASASLLTALPSLPGSANPWKFVLSVPITVIVLAAFSGHHWVRSVVALGVLAAIGAAADSRSYAGLAILTAALVTLSHIRRGFGGSWNRAAITAMVLVSVTGLYYAGTSLLVDGALGDQVAERTRQQLDQSGNLITGGRPEWMATAQLASLHPLGLGTGIVPQGHDVHAAKVGLHSVGVPTYAGYVENYMTAGQFKLHSVLADLWIHCGWWGAAAGLTLFGVCCYILLTAIGHTGLTALTGYLMFNALWFLLFGPLYTDIPFVAMALGLALIPRADLRAATTGDATADESCPAPPLIARK